METTYNQVLYRGLPFGQTHPDRLATLATLFGVSPAPVERCRVLEIGCGDGGNLIPMAFMLPNSTFAGFDLAETPIAMGQQAAKALGVSARSNPAKVLLGSMNAIGIRLPPSPQPISRTRQRSTGAGDTPNSVAS